MSVSIKPCPKCGQTNPASSSFCPVCGESIREIKPQYASWTAIHSFPPMPESLRKRGRNFKYVSDGEGAGMAWVGFILVSIPILFSTRATVMYIAWGVGMAMVLGGFYRMRRDLHTLSRAGLTTNAIAALTLAAIIYKLFTSSIAPDQSAAVAPPTTSQPTATADWSVAQKTTPTANGSVLMFRGDPEHTGQNAGPGPLGQVFRQWRVDTEGEVYSSPAVTDGMVYIGSKSGFLFALDAKTGDERWRKDLGDYIVRSSPAVDHGLVFVGGGFTLYALDVTTGDTVWSSSIPFSGSSSPTITGGKVLIGSQSGGVYAFDEKTGKQLWNAQLDGLVFATPSIENGIAIVGSDSGRIQAINLDSGQETWRYQMNGSIYASPAVANGIAFVSSAGDNGGETVAISVKSGQVIWTAPVGSEAAPTISGNDLFIGSTDGGLYLLDARSGGDPKWLFPTGGTISTSPVISGNSVYVASDSTLFAVDAATGVESWRYAAGYSIETTPVIVNGIAYIGGLDGYFDAIAGDGKGS